MVTLPAPGGSVPLHVNLNFVQKLEEAGGGLYRIAEKLVARETGFAEAARLLHVVYVHAGVAMTAEEIGDYLLQNGPAPPALLSDILIAVLEPLHRMGKAQPARPA